MHPKMDAEDNPWLRREITFEEVLKNENLNKAPGPDDFPAAFCQRMWPHTLIKLLKFLKSRSDPQIEKFNVYHPYSEAGS